MDSTEHGPKDNLTDLERRLGRWQPAPVRLDRDRMFFEAGRAAARAETRTRISLASAAAFALVAVGLGVLFLRERVQRHALEVQIVRLSSKPSPPPLTVAPAASPIVERPPAPESYLVLMHQSRTGGLIDSPTLRAPHAASGVDTRSEEPTLRVREIHRLLNF